MSSRQMLLEFPVIPNPDQRILPLEPNPGTYIGFLSREDQMEVKSSNGELMHSHLQGAFRRMRETLGIPEQQESKKLIFSNDFGDE